LHLQIHEQKNIFWDSFSLFFKANRNGPDDDFWHTKTYQKAIKLLKNAYLALPAMENNHRVAEENYFIDYVRGNAMRPYPQTETRRKLNPR